MKTTDKTAPIKLHFTPTENFYSPEFRSHYEVGLSYTLRKPWPVDEGDKEQQHMLQLRNLLEECVHKWHAEGKISLSLPSVSPLVTVKVKGHVDVSKK